MDLHIISTPSLSEKLETITYDYRDKHGKRVLNLWDITEGGGRALRQYETWWTNFRQCPRGIVIVVDSASHDPLSMELAAERLSTVLQEEVEDSSLLPLLVLANKQDSPHATTTADVKDLLGLERLPQEQA